MRIRKRATEQEGTMVKGMVSNFLGKVIDHNNAGEAYTDSFGGPYESCLTINAMDGTVIDRDLDIKSCFSDLENGGKCEEKPPGQYSTIIGQKRRRKRAGRSANLVVYKLHEKEISFLYTGGEKRRYGLVWPTLQGKRRKDAYTEAE